MSIEDLKINTASSLFNMHGLDGTYTPVSGDAVSIKCFRALGEAVRDHDFQVSDTRTAVISVLVADVATPGFNDKIVIGSETYSVGAILGGDAAVWKLHCEVHD